jgi:hypothetical protein
MSRDDELPAIAQSSPSGKHEPTIPRRTLGGTYISFDDKKRLSLRWGTGRDKKETHVHDDRPIISSQNQGRRRQCVISRAPTRAKTILVNKLREGCGVVEKQPRIPAGRAHEKPRTRKPRCPSAVVVVVLFEIIHRFTPSSSYSRGERRRPTTLLPTTPTVSNRRAVLQLKHILSYERLEFSDSTRRPAFLDKTVTAMMFGYMIVQPVDMPELTEHDCNKQG